MSKTHRKHTRETEAYMETHGRGKMIVLGEAKAAAQSRFRWLVG